MGEFQGDSFLLKVSNRSEEMLQFLLSHEWETRPDMNIRWIINNIDNLYILTDFVGIFIGFMVLDKNGKLYYFEILNEYRNKGYARNILNHIKISFVYVDRNDEQAERFWKHMQKTIIYI